MAVTTVAREYDKAFCVDDKFFTRVEKLATDPAGALRVEIWLSDSSSIENLTITDLIAFPNLSARRIVRVDLETHHAAMASFHLTMRSEDFIAPASYRIVGKDKDATYLSAELDKLLRDAFTWYSHFSILSGWLIAICFSVIALGLMAELIGLVGMKTNAGEILVRSNTYVAIIAAVIVIITALYLFVRKRLFPVSTFRIGDGVIRANKSESVRHAIASIVFGGVILGLLVHVFGSRIYDVVFGH
jgi:hypothetical protein